jgi:hypothetical protein
MATDFLRRADQSVDESRPIAGTASPQPSQASDATGLASERVSHATHVVNTAMANAFARCAKIRSFLWHLIGSRFPDGRLPFEDHAAVLASDHVPPEPEYVRFIGGTTIRCATHTRLTAGAVVKSAVATPARLEGGCEVIRVSLDFSGRRQSQTPLVPDSFPVPRRSSPRGAPARGVRVTPHIREMSPGSQGSA